MAKDTDRFDEPIWKLEVEYEAILRSTVAHSTYLRASEILYSLLIAHPKKTMPADFAPGDIDAWIEARLAEGYATKTVRRDLEHIYAFFRWMRIVKGSLVPNPVTQLRN